MMTKSRTTDRAGDTTCQGDSLASITTRGHRKVGK